MYTQQPDFYIASSDVSPDDDFARPRKCWLKKRFASTIFGDSWLIKIDPPIPGQEFGPGEHDVDELVIAAKYPADVLDHIRNWPVYVNVGRFRGSNVSAQPKHRGRDFQALLVAELYPTEEAARIKAR